MTITYGILTPFDIFNSLIHEMEEISEYNAKQIPKRINWKDTIVYDNSNRVKRVFS